MSLALALEDAKQTATLRRHARFVSNQLSDYGVFLPTPHQLGGHTAWQTARRIPKKLSW
jgi:hypothetical protein